MLLHCKRHFAVSRAAGYILCSYRKGSPCAHCGTFSVRIYLSTRTHPLAIDPDAFLLQLSENLGLAYSNPLLHC